MLKTFAATTTAAMHALLGAALAVACIAAIDSLAQHAALVSVAGSVFLAFLGTLVVGAPLVVLYGVPTYSFLARRGKVNLVPLVLLSMLPGAAILFASVYFGVLAIVSGAIVAVLTRSFLANER